MDKKDKRALRFLNGYIATTLSVLGYLCVGFLSPNPYIWWIATPIIIFIAWVNCKMLVVWLDEVK